MKKIMIMSAVVLGLSAPMSVQAGPAAGVLTTAAKAAGAILGGSNTETETTISNSTITNDTNITDSNVLGNSGVELRGDKLKVTNSKIENKTKITDSNVMGNSGIKVGN